jgi:glycosyltransferase involved in cell wall biosynthesis
LKILHCLFSRGFAGTERHVAELTAQQARQHSVTLVLAADCGDPGTGADIRSHLSPAVRVRCLPPLRQLLGLWSLLRAETPDIVHAHLGRASHRLALLQPNAGLVTTLHRRYRRWPHGRFDGVVCIAGWQRGTVTARHAAIDTIHNWTTPRAAIDQRRREQQRQALGVPQETFLYGAAGRLVPEKGFDVLLQAFERAAPAAGRLILFGDGPDRARLEALAPPGTIFAGYRPDLPAELALLDAFVLPSHHEPFGLVLLEAMAAGLKEAATASGGPLDILGPGHPFLVPAGDVAALARCLAQLPDAPPPAHDLSRFTLTGQSRRLEGFYRQVLDARRMADWRATGIAAQTR